MKNTKCLAIFSVFVLFIGFSNSAFAQVSNIGSSGQDGVSVKTVPEWIKTSMQFWVEGQTSDAEFLNAVEFLANEEIIQVSVEDVRKDITINDQEESSASGTWDTEMISMNAERADSFFDIFYESYTADSFFDIWTELQESTDSFFDVFFEADTPRTNECLRGQELGFNERTSKWECSPANAVDSFFDVFFDVATESSQNSEDIEELERKIASLEEKIATIEREMKESGEKGGTEDINIGVGELP
ncbi:MAG: hypothetical protein PVH93_00210 [Nitrosopumilaceae archaeon]